MISKICTLILIVFLSSSCSNDSDKEDNQTLKDIIIEVVLFEFTPDTGNNTLRLRYEIKFTNPNDTAIKGFYKITTTADGLETTMLSTTDTPCYEIDANSDCILRFDAEDSLDLARINSIVLNEVVYTISE
jgi:hypothetical protein